MNRRSNRRSKSLLPQGLSPLTRTLFLEILNRRTQVVEQIGRVKQSVNLPIYEPKREDDVFRNVRANNHGPLDSDALRRIFERIIDEMRSLQKMRRAGEK